ncbi:hypothetical protein ABZ721_33200 [Streptomyces sp. NPDC006733]|uniref:hypothetical protein n=1 Tax=Streptomyces sp. NPDC006733 TaxID=3155460 RepID=UPI0033C4157F
MRLVESAHYSDAALAVYMKISALGRRAEGCTAAVPVLAAYLHLGRATVERSLTQLRNPGPDGVVELPDTQRRTLRGGRGTTAVRRVRTLSRSERFVWLPVAAAEDLSPRQLRAYAVLAYAVAQNIPLTEAELASFLVHHRGFRAQHPITTWTASSIIDALEELGWISVDRRAGAYGRHVFTVRSCAPEDQPSAAPEAGTATPSEQPATAVHETDLGSGVGEGSGLGVGEGSLAYKEDPSTVRPDDERTIASPAVGEMPVVERVGVRADALRDRAPARRDCALRADGKPFAASPTTPDAPARTVRAQHHGPYKGPQLSYHPEIHQALEPVRYLLSRVSSVYRQREIGRAVGAAVRAHGLERVQHRLTVRFATAAPAEIRDPASWLLRVALPHWGCGDLDCEQGTRWSTGQRCEICQDVLIFRRREMLSAAGTPQSLRTVEPPSAVSTTPPLRGRCGDCQCVIRVCGKALVDGLCPLCRTERAGRPSCPARDALPAGGRDVGRRAAGSTALTGPPISPAAGVSGRVRRLGTGQERGTETAERRMGPSLRRPAQ